MRQEDKPPSADAPRRSALGGSDLGALFDRHVDWVYGVARFLVPDDRAAADLAELVWADAVRASRDGDGEERLIVLLAEATQRRGLAAARAAGGRNAMSLALLALPGRERALLLLRFGGGLTLAESARALGVPASEAMELQLAGLRRLRALLGPADRSRRSGQRGET